MDATIVNVAIPSIRTDLGATASQLQWVIDVYTLVLASLLMLSGAMGDRFGRRRVFQAGLLIFAIGSLLCSLAPNIETLIAARFVQAVGGSMMNPVAMSIITQVFTGRVERARAIGVWGGVVGISMLGARLHSREPIANTVSPIWKVRRRPNRSAAAPASSSSDASTSV